MDPSSLIFVAVIGIWASYLLGHWVRRRDQLATARSVDRFSETMRVLERRAPAPVFSARTRAHVVAAVRAPSAPTRYAATVSAATTATAPVRARAVRPSAPAAPVAAQPVPTPSRAGRTSASTGVGPAAARRRGRLLAGLVTATVLGWLFAGVTPLPWLVPAFVTCLLTAFVVGLRRAVVRERTSARSAHAARAATALPRQTVASNQPAEPRDVRLARRAAVQAQAPLTEPSNGTSITAAQQDGTTAADEPGNEPVVNAPAAKAPSFPSAPVGPGWQPIPVPPPTYTLKPKAPIVPRPAAPATAARKQDETAPLDLDEILERRIASGA